MKKIMRLNVGTLSVLVFLLSPIHIFAKDITVSKVLLAYTVTIDNVSQKYLAKGGAQTSIVSFTLKPQKYVPAKVTLYANSDSWELTGITQGGSYTAELVEGTDLMEVKNYGIKITADNAISNSSDVTVFDFVGKITPLDNFAGRNQAKYGIAEKLILESLLTPSNLTPSQIGGLRWKKVSGVGALTNVTNTGTADFDVGAAPGSISLQLEIVSGFSQGKSKSYAKTAVAPTGAYMVQVPGSGIWHVSGYATVGFKGDIYFEPKDVSFSGIEFREGTCTGTGTGYLLPKTGEVHAIGPWIAVGSGNSSTGCQLLGYDTVSTGMYPPPFGSGGTFTWPIPWQYRVGTGSDSTFTTATHYETVSGVGAASITKAGAGPFSKNLNDPSSTY